MKLFKNSLVIGGFTLISRVLGLVRDLLMAAVLGAGPIADAFFAAFRLPNLFRRIFAEGAFNSAFVPLYAGKLENEGEAAADAFAREAMAALLTIVFALVLLFELSMPFVMSVIATGFLENPDLFAKAVLFGQITMPYIAFMSLAAMFGGILNARHKFAVAAAAPIVLNIVLIAVLMSRPDGAAATALRLSIGVAISGVLQAGVVIWGCKMAGVKLGLSLPRFTPAVKRLLWLTLPGALSAGVVQINLVVSQRFASMQEHAISWLQYADRLYQLPLGMVGIAMGVALLPGLTRQVRQGDEEGAKAALNEALQLASAFTLPAAAALYVIPLVFVEGLFMRGAFAQIDAINTAAALHIYALGLPSFILIKVFAPAYFAREDTKTPMLFAAFSMILNVILCAVFFYMMGFVGLALATTLASWLNAVLLGGDLWRRGRFVPGMAMGWRLIKLVLASAVMGVVLVYTAGPLRRALDFLPWTAFWVAMLIAALGMVVYGLSALALGGMSRAELKAVFGRK
jgi:putative peptidoglycan lipid II flippase